MRAIDTRIDPESCIGCGECVRVCPSWAISLEGDKAVVTGEWSIGCGHCAAVCPSGAVTVGFIDPDAVSLKSVFTDDRYVPPGEYDSAELVRLMRSRRSCRNYSEKPVPLEILQDLVRIGTTAPSGTNSQMWTFTLVPDRRSVMVLGQAVADFFRKLNRQAENPALRLLARLFMKDALGEYHREYYEAVKEGLRQFEEEGVDRLFHGASAVILVGSEPGAACPAEDALLASQNILLAAHAMGLGSCLIGFVVEAMKHDSRIRRLLGIPKEEKVHSVIALGYPDEEYQEPAGRRMVSPSPS